MAAFGSVADRGEEPGAPGDFCPGFHLVPVSSSWRHFQLQASVPEPVRVCYRFVCFGGVFLGEKGDVEAKAA